MRLYRSLNFNNEAKDESDSYDRKSQLRSQGLLLAFPRLHVAHDTNMAAAPINGILSGLYIIDDRSVGSIQILPIIDIN